MKAGVSRREHRGYSMKEDTRGFDETSVDMVRRKLEPASDEFGSWELKYRYKGDSESCRTGIASLVPCMIMCFWQTPYHMYAAFMLALISAPEGSIRSGLHGISNQWRRSERSCL